VVRNSTERPEVCGTFAQLVRPGERISEHAHQWFGFGGLLELHEKLSSTASPYGDGSASRLCVDALTDLVGR
jgi:hypothetical protein